MDNKNDSYELAKSANELTQKGKFSMAIKLLRKAIEINPLESGFYYNLGNILYRQEKYIKAKEQYLEANKLKPNNEYYLIQLALTYFQLDQYANSIRYYELALELNPQNLNAIHDKGLAYYNLERYEEAIRCYNRVLKLDSKHFNSLRNKALVLSKMCRYDESLKFYDQALGVKSNDSDTLTDKGVMYAKLHKWEIAIQCYDKSIENNLKHSRAYFNKGIALKNLGRREEALEFFQKAIKFNQNYEDAYLQYGLLSKEIKYGKRQLFKPVERNTESCFVAFFDILGFKDLISNNTHSEIIKIYKETIDFLLSASLSEVNASFKGPTEYIINSQSISDSFIFWTNNTSLESFYAIFTASSMLLITSIIAGIPLRGAITTGPLFHFHGLHQYNYNSIRSVLVGKSLVNAYELEKTQDWSGCIICDQSIKLYKKNIKHINEEDPYGISNLIKSNLIVKYNVPLHDNKHKEYYTVNWTLGQVFQTYHETEIEQSFQAHNKRINDDKVKTKIQNTITFYKEMMKNKNSE